VATLFDCRFAFGKADLFLLSIFSGTKMAHGIRTGQLVVLVTLAVHAAALPAASHKSLQDLHKHMEIDPTPCHAERLKVCSMRKRKKIGQTKNETLFFLGSIAQPIIFKLPPYTMAGFDLTTHSSASSGETTWPRCQSTKIIYVMC
jgi:hypothetical protein